MSNIEEIIAIGTEITTLRTQIESIKNTEPGKLDGVPEYEKATATIIAEINAKIQKLTDVVNSYKGLNPNKGGKRKSRRSRKIRKTRKQKRSNRN